MADTSPHNARILVVDDDPGLLDLIEMRLMAEGYTVSCAASGAEALELFRSERPRVVISDLRMDGMDGHALFARLHAEAPTVPVIMLTAHGTIPDAVAATQRGVFGFLTKPFDGHELLAKVTEALALSPQVRPEHGAAPVWHSELVSHSLAMDELLRQASRVADDDTPLLITGPRGCGKEALARAIHITSRRAHKPFIAMRCSELPVAKGANSPLNQALSDAKGGTLLLDDIEELPAMEQARLLPLVQAGNLFLSRAPAAACAARIVATSAISLESVVRDGRLRADLFYALGRPVLNVPALTERKEDIQALVAHFSAHSPHPKRSFSPEALALLQESSWPGNVRQLRNVVEQALAQSVTAQVPATLLRRLLNEENAREMAALDDARRLFEHDYLIQLLETTSGNVSRAAKVAQRNRTEFYKLLARHNIDPALFKQDKGMGSSK